jgi:DNA-binding response OmpR family regulator
VKILIVEDEKRIVSFVKNGLKSEGFTVDSANDAEEGLFLAGESSYDLVVLDVMLPGMDGIALCKKLRSMGKAMPIIMLTAKDAVEDRVKGLDAGADDYLTKPFSFVELLARVRALTRRHHPTRSKTLKIGDLAVDTEAHAVTRGKKVIELSPTEFKLLSYLMENQNKALSKSLILENIWGYDFSPESNIVDVYIKYLRDKIDKGSRKSLIQTVYGVGYKICD